ncbi:DegV family protein [Guggenheimella bovis]
MKFILTCDSTVDLSNEELERMQVKYVPYTFQMDGVVYTDDLGKTMSYDEFFTRIEKGAMPTTSLVPPVEYEAFFEPLLKEGNDVLHLAFSSGLSGSFQSALSTAEMLKEKYPDRKIIVVDSLAASSGYGLLLSFAVDRRDEGMTIEETRDWLEENKIFLNHWFFSSDLTHYKRGGRISAAQAAVGGLLNICPLMDVNDEGKLIPRQKIRGKKRVIEEVVKIMRERAEGGVAYSGRIYINHSKAYEDALELKALVEKTFPKAGEIKIFSIGTVIGSHTGPKTVSLFYQGEKRGR